MPEMFVVALQDWPVIVVCVIVSVPVVDSPTRQAQVARRTARGRPCARGVRAVWVSVGCDRVGHRHAAGHELPRAVPRPFKTSMSLGDMSDSQPADARRPKGQEHRPDARAAASSREPARDRPDAAPVRGGQELPGRGVVGEPVDDDGRQPDAERLPVGRAVERDPEHADVGARIEHARSAPRRPNRGRSAAS